MNNIKPFSRFPSLTSSDLFSNRFEQIDKLFSQLTGNKPLTTSTSAYDLKKLDESHYELTVSVPGYKENELNVVLQNGQLSINGKKEETQKEENKEEKWLHKGLSRSEFSLMFDLGEHVKVQKADLSGGLLTLMIEYEIPEEKKPQSIMIENKDAK